jgi:ribonucleotide reductase, class II
MTFDDFSANTANPVFYRTYSRRTEKGRESWAEVCNRTLTGLALLGNFTSEEIDLVVRMQMQLKALPSGRWLWVGGTPWVDKPENYPGAYNCSSTNITDWKAFGLMMDLAMQGCGTGAVLEPKYIKQLPEIRNHLNVEVVGEIGAIPPNNRADNTTVLAWVEEVKKPLVVKTLTKFDQVQYLLSQHLKVDIIVGDSRQGWVEAYQSILEFAALNVPFTSSIDIQVDISNVRPMGEPLKGFGGVANPIKLKELFPRVAAILNKAADRRYSRQLTAVDCCLLIGEGALAVVAGNIRRSAGMRQGSEEDMTFAYSKDNLWKQTEDGNWRIDPERDVLRMANHTRVYHQKPSLQECIQAVDKQFHSGEGAIQWAGEAVARANADLLDTADKKAEFLKAYDKGKAEELLLKNYYITDSNELNHRLSRYGLNPCGR